MYNYYTVHVVYLQHNQQCTAVIMELYTVWWQVSGVLCPFCLFCACFCAFLWFVQAVTMISIEMWVWQCHEPVPLSSYSDWKLFSEFPETAFIPSMPSSSFLWCLHSFFNFSHILGKLNEVSDSCTTLLQFLQISTECFLFTNKQFSPLGELLKMSKGCFGIRQMFSIVTINLFFSIDPW